MSICGGADFCLFLNGDGQLEGSGAATDGQQGHPHGTDSQIPRAIPELPRITAVCTGISHSLCVTDEGSVYAFGQNAYGQLGVGHSNTCCTPVRLDLPPIRAVASKYHHSICIAQDDSVWAFGRNDQGQLGIGHTMDVCEPTLLEQFSAFQVACGNYHTMFVSSGGRLYGCGCNEEGQLGLGHHENVYAPKHIPLDVEIVHVDCGTNFTAMLTSLGTVWTAGRNAYGELGLGHTKPIAGPEEIPALEGVVRITCGTSHTLCVTSSGELYGWGNNRYALLGEPARPSPQQLSDNVRCCCTTMKATFVLKEDGSVLVCGSNLRGELGMDDQKSRLKAELHPGITESYFPSSLRYSRAKSAKKVA